jgi:hypothetical protein
VTSSQAACREGWSAILVVYAIRRLLTARPVLLLAFAFAVMGDPVSSVAYAIEAALRALDGRLALLLPTMGIVVGIIGLVIANYHRLVARFPGGGDAAAAGTAFGEGWAFLPLGALIVDYALTIAISVAAAASAVIAYQPSLGDVRVPLALVLLAAVAGLTWFGHAGRAVFALMTLSFVAVGSAVLAVGLVAPHGHGSGVLHPAGAHGSEPLAVLLAFPVAMALATGVEAPSSAVAQLGQLDHRGKVQFGRVTLWLTLGIVAWLTIGLTVVAVRLRVGLPPTDSTQMAEVARAAAGGGGLFAAFQLTSAVLLLAAASSSYQAGPGLLKALSRGGGEGHGVGVLPAPLGAANRHHTPYWGVVVFFFVAAAVVAAAGGREQELVLFYAVAVFMSFLFGLLSMAAFSRREGARRFLLLNAIAIAAVALTLAVNLRRGYPIASLGAACAIALVLHRLWTRAGRPRGVSEVERLAEEELAEAP